MDVTELPTAILAAAERLAAHVRCTPLLESEDLSARLNGTIGLKLENLQRTGSFKLRGAMNKLTQLAVEERARGVVTASSGNHGAAVAYAARSLGMACRVFVPEGAAPSKMQAITRYGVQVETFGVDGVDTELHAREVAAAEGSVYVSPYNDWDVVAGQGMIGVELRRQMPQLDTVVIAVGGGGLIGGIAADLKAHLPGIRVVGAAPANSPAMYECVRAGQVIDVPTHATLSDGTAGGVEPGSVTLELCRTLVDDWVLVGEDEIAAGVRHCLTVEHQVVEGAAGVVVAAVLQRPELVNDRHTALVLCGGNIGAEKLRTVLCS